MLGCTIEMIRARLKVNVLWWPVKESHTSSEISHKARDRIDPNGASRERKHTCNTFAVHPQQSGRWKMNNQGVLISFQNTYWHWYGLAMEFLLLSRFMALGCKNESENKLLNKAAFVTGQADILRDFSELVIDEHKERSWVPLNIICCWQGWTGYWLRGSINSMWGYNNCLVTGCDQHIPP